MSYTQLFFYAVGVIGGGLFLNHMLTTGFNFLALLWAYKREAPKRAARIKEEQARLRWLQDAGDEDLPRVN